MKPLSPTDLKRLHRSWRKKTDQPLAVILDGVQQPFNLGGILRSAAAYGVRDLWLVPPMADPADKKVQTTAKGCDRFLRIRVADSGAQAVMEAKEAGYRVVAVELVDQAVPLFAADLADTPVALVLGHEERGVHRDTLDAADLIAFLPLTGHVGSLNVGHSAAAALSEVRRQGWSV
ncbi:MAG: TrmH family RNA methyltransferase [Acidimicrobiia bacterium]|nr:TrmH family RNA methyltransferase [Acidimicrobiia bacterium]